MQSASLWCACTKHTRPMRCGRPAREESNGKQHQLSTSLSRAIALHLVLSTRPSRSRLQPHIHGSRPAPFSELRDIRMLQPAGSAEGLASCACSVRAAKYGRNEGAPGENHTRAPSCASGCRTSRMLKSRGYIVGLEADAKLCS